MTIPFLRLWLTASLFLMYSWCWSLAQPIALSPPPKQIDLTGDSVTIQGVNLLLDEAVRTQFGAAVAAIEQTLGGRGEGITVHARLHSNTEDVPANIRQALTHREAYVLEITRETITVVGSDALGVLHGLTTLEQLVQARKKVIPQGRILDWPDLKVRGLRLSLGGKGVVGPSVSSETVRAFIVQARQWHYNLLILGLSHTVRFPTMARIARENAWTVEELLDVVRFARENGLEVVPEIRTLTHQGNLLRDKYPNLMYNRSTYDPRKQETYAVVLPMLDEVIDAIRPKALHIGHDEVAGFARKSAQKWLSPGENMLPPELFLQDVLRLHAHLQKRGVETWMWGDMLVSPQEFPGVQTKNLHGMTKNYASLRNKLPKDIVICDWHYSEPQSEFPSALAFMKSGFRVLGATKDQETVIRNFSRYVARIGGEGMLATTWANELMKKRDTVERTIRVSGEAFWNAR